MPSQENKSTNSISNAHDNRKKNGMDAAVEFADHRPEAAVQRQLQQLIDNSVPQGKSAGNSGQETEQLGTHYPAPVQRFSPGNLVMQRVAVYAKKIDKGYFEDRSAAGRQGKFTAAVAEAAAARTALVAIRRGLNQFLVDFDISASADNPVVLAIAKLTELEGNVSKPPTQKRWTDSQALEDELIALDDATLRTESYNHEKENVKAAIRQIRRDTVGKREYILTLIGVGEVLPGAKGQAIVSLKAIKAQVDAALQAAETAANAGNWAPYTALPGQLAVFEDQAITATDVPLHDELAAMNWDDPAAVAINPRTAAIYRQTHILDNHKHTSAVPGKGKFRTDTWTDIKGWIDTAKTNGAITGPIFDTAGGHPNGRFQIEHDIGANIGLNSGNNASTTIRVIVTRTGKTVVTAFPI